MGNNLEVKLVPSEANLKSAPGKQPAANQTDAPITNVLIVGVGGQGTLLASRVLAQAVMATGADGGRIRCEEERSPRHGPARRQRSYPSSLRT